MTKAKWKVPQGWEWASFDDVAQVASKLVDPKVFPTYAHIAPNHIESHTGRLLDYSTVEHDRVTSPKHLFGVGHILYSKIRPYLAKAVLVDFEGLCSADMYPVTTGIDSRYLHRWLISPMFTGLTAQNQGRTVLPKINQRALGKLAVPVAPLYEQRRIVAKLEALQRRTRRARAALDAIPPLLERFRQSVLSAAFRGDLTADWRAQNPDVEPASVLLERIREERRRRWEEAELAKMKAKGKVPSDDRWKVRFKYRENQKKRPLHELPAGWSRVRIDELAELVTSGSRGWGKYYSTNGPLFIRVGNLNRYTIDLDLASAVSVNPPVGSEGIRTLVQEGDILLSITADVGMVAVAHQELGEAYVNQHVALIRLLPGVNSRAFAYSLLDPNGFQRLAVEQQYGMTKAGLSLVQVREFTVPLPPIAEQEEICKRLDYVLSRFDEVESWTNESGVWLEQLDRSVLAKAFRGELVPQDPNDEPASKLLERIRAAKQEEPARRGRRRAKDREPRQEAPTPKPSRPQPSQDAAPKPEPPLPNDTDLRDRVHRVLLGRGPLDRDTAIREAASALRDDGTVDFKRLRRGGPLYQSLEQAVDTAHAANLLDEPVPGEVRAVLRDARAYTPDDWRHALLSCLGDEPAEREDAIEAAAFWAAENMGLEFQRLRRDGVIVKGLKSALRAAIRRGEVERLGPSKVRKSMGRPGL